MKQATASNIALALAILAWPLCSYGFFSLLVDFVPDTPRDVIEPHQLASYVALLAGLLSLLASLCLCAFGFSGAKVRSLIAIAVCLGLILLAVLTLVP
ncbi:hypothetical protein LF41_2911 [Lysobacter dokdonensis DS-58]|uniref:Transmembrane protein n=1 Tax=Lysobacter dokdonensis DS-58 TaxID=1300345 RepID=A0A0A2WLW6_9GAMM|nr:hypothetical protein [Lysobacter dokdonensis]KGQ19265.1 hypothetical protein LF41_2911 [Lysobacter dokdonensis DS-58]